MKKGVLWTSGPIQWRGFGDPDTAEERTLYLVLCTNPPVRSGTPGVVPSAGEGIHFYQTKHSTKKEERCTGPHTRKVLCVAHSEHVDNREKGLSSQYDFETLWGLWTTTREVSRL